MKNFKILIAVLSLVCTHGIAQPTLPNLPDVLTPNGTFDDVYDRFGNKYKLSEVSLLSHRPFGSSYSIATIPTESCQAGYFRLFFGPNTIFTSGANSVQAQAVVCELYSNMSGFINSSLSPTAPVNVFFGSNVGTGQLANASAVLVYPILTSPLPDLLDGMVYKAITSGTDPYLSIPIASVVSTSTNQPGFYHGIVNVSTATNVAWNLTTSLTTVATNEYDLYTVMHHELVHMLGFHSLMFANGDAVYATPYNYLYSRYDQFLTNFAGVPLLSQITATACGNPNSFLGFNSLLTPSASIEQSLCVNSSGNVDVTTCSVAARYVSSNVTATVYTPFCFEPGSSLSHFEDMCSYGSFTTSCVPTQTPGYNDLYYLMSNFTHTGSTTCYVKRTLQQEERQVLCDLGYSTNTTFTSNAAGATRSYASCPPTATVVGVNDGYDALTSNFIYTTSTTSVAIPTSSLLINDFPVSGMTVTCPQMITGNATLTVVGSSIVVTAIQGSGMHVMRYYPQNSSGQYGNPTYVFFYFIPAGCPPGTSCNMVQNPGFELLTGGPACGNINNGGVTTPTLCAWRPYNYLMTLHTVGCMLSTGEFNLGSNTLWTSPPVSSFNGSAANTRAVNLSAFSGWATSMSNVLATPLVPGQTYQLSLWLQNPVRTSGGFSINPNSVAVPLTIASHTSNFSIPNTSFPAGLNILTEFTVPVNNAWSVYTNTFVYPGNLSPGSLLVVGINSVVCSSLAPGASILMFLDDLNLIPLPAPLATLQTVCGGVSIPNLAAYVPSVVTAYTFSGTGVSFNGSNYQFNPTGTLSPGIYTLAMNYTTNTGCDNTVYQSVQVSTPLTLSVNGTFSVCTNGSSGTTLSVTSSPSGGVSFTWQPGGLTGATQTLNPASTSIHTVFASSSSSNVCPASQTMQINVLSNCCGTLVLPALTATSIATSSFVFSGYVANNFTVLAGASPTLYGNYLIADGVGITVAPGGTLEVSGAHLFSCDEMWQGITVQDGGQLWFGDLSIPGGNLIEDAITAVDISNATTSSLSTIFHSNNTIFNKNLIDIKLHNYQRSSNSYSNVVTLVANAFTCRYLNPGLTSWPLTSGAASVNVRSAANPTTGLESPFLFLSAPTATLKAPYAGQTSSVAVLITSVGITSGSTFYGISLGSDAALGDFNLFDNHNKFIHCTNSNVSVKNNVFQNTRFVGTTTVGLGDGAAVFSGAPSVMSNRLDLAATNFDLGNRFWNCHYGVQGYNVYNFDIEKGIFRSTQTSTNTTGVLPGNTGILLNTNRAQYRVVRNEFTNVRTGVNVPLSTAAYTLAAPCGTCVSTGIYATNMSIQQNTLSAGTSTAVTPYMNRAIYITSPLQASWTVNNVTNISPFTLGIILDDNRVIDAYNGIGIKGVQGWRSSIAGNHIRLVDDNALGIAERGIEQEDCNATPSSYAWIKDNDVYAIGSTSLSNTDRSLIYAYNNMGPYLGQPSLTCNNLHDSHHGFVFEGPNQGSSWYGNKMENLEKGMALANSGVIGAQGTPTVGMGNRWNGSWGGTNYGIYTYTSNAGQSTLYVSASVTPNYPPNPWGNPFQTSYFTASLSPITNTLSGASYDCFAPNSRSNNPIIPLPAHYGDDESFYIALTALYKFLNQNDSIKNAHSSLTTFFSNLSGSSIDEFLKAEDYLMIGDLVNAATIIGAISPTNNVETNYLTYYNLYLSYAANRFEPTSSGDENDLKTLAEACPGTDGACVSQARALHNLVFKNAEAWPVCAGSGAKPYFAQQDHAEQPSLKLYPNPAQNAVFIKSSIERDILSIEITDLSGRIVLYETEKVEGFIAKLDLDLLNGAYIVKIVDQKNEQTVKKLIIAK